MAYSKSRDAYPRVVEMIVTGLANRTRRPFEERVEGDNVFRMEFDTPTEAASIRYNIYGWIQVLLRSGTKEEMETAKLAQRWKIAAEGNYIICTERDSPAALSKALAQLAEAGML